jgi:hypothetical protein
MLVGKNCKTHAENEAEWDGDQRKFQSDDERMLELIALQDVGVLAPAHRSTVTTLEVAALLTEPDRSTEWIQDEGDENRK